MLNPVNRFGMILRLKCPLPPRTCMIGVRVQGKLLLHKGIAKQFLNSEAVRLIYMYLVYTFCCRSLVRYLFVNCQELRVFGGS